MLAASIGQGNGVTATALKRRCNGVTALLFVREVLPYRRRLSSLIDRMHQVEFGRALRHNLEQCRLRHDRVGAGAAEAKSARPCRDQFRTCYRAAAGKQRYLMAKRNQLVDQPRDHALRSVVP